MSVRSSVYYILFIVAIGSCNNEDPVPDLSRVGFQFFPLQVGQVSTYAVEEINYFITGEVEMNSFELKVEVVDSFTNQAGELTYVINRLQRPTERDEFTFQEAWSARITDNNVIESEGATPFVRISFPLEAGKEWDGNAFNALEEDTYEMDSLFSTYITSAQDTIQSTLTVIRGDNEDFVLELDRRFDIYGEDIGLVYQEEVRLAFCTEPECIGQQIIESGREYRQTLISHVKN